MHYYFNAAGEWEQWDISELSGGWAIGGDPAASYDGSSVFVRQADNHLAHFFFNSDGEWEHWDVSEQAGGWAIGGDPAIAHDGSGVFVRRADNHLAHFHFNSAGEWEQWDISLQAASWQSARQSGPNLDERGMLTPPLRKIERKIAARRGDRAPREESSDFDWKYLMGH